MAMEGKVWWAGHSQTPLLRPPATVGLPHRQVGLPAPGHPAGGGQRGSECINLDPQTEGGLGAHRLEPLGLSPCWALPQSPAPISSLQTSASQP